MKKIILSIILLIFISFMGCAEEDVWQPPEKPITYSVEYEVKGTAKKVDITYENEDEGTSQWSNIIPPWTYKFTGEEGQFVYISAQNDDSIGSVTVTIYVDSTIFKTSTSSGAYVIATADGTLGD